MECVHVQFTKHPTPRCLTCPLPISEIGARQMTGNWMNTSEYKQLRASLLADAQRNVRPDITQAALERQSLQTELEAAVLALRPQHDALSRELKEVKRRIARLQDALREGRHLFQTNPDDIPALIRRARELLASSPDAAAAAAPSAAAPSAAAPPDATPALRCSRPNCRGVVLGRACSMCGTRCCLVCRSILADDEVFEGEAGSAAHRQHQCDSATLASIATINSNSKACPRCFVQIQRSEGCNNMYCTQCGQFFNYATGLPISGVVHNPEYQAEQLRTRCARERVYFRVPPESFFGQRTARDAFLRLTNMLTDRQRVCDQFPLASVGDPFLEARCNLTNGTMTEEQFKTRLVHIHTAEARRMEWGMLVRVLFDSIVDVTIGVGSDGRTVFAYCNQVKELYNIMSKAAREISKAFNVAHPPLIHDMLRVCHVFASMCEDASVAPDVDEVEEVD